MNMSTALITFEMHYWRHACVQQSLPWCGSIDAKGLKSLYSECYEATVKFISELSLL